jgi:hypothetical protein
MQANQTLRLQHLCLLVQTYDVSFVRRDIPGKTFVGLNIMWWVVLHPATGNQESCLVPVQLDAMRAHVC